VNSTAQRAIEYGGVPDNQGIHALLALFGNSLRDFQENLSSLFKRDNFLQLKLPIIEKALPKLLLLKRRWTCGR
jgi:hypothetical protein